MKLSLFYSWCFTAQAEVPDGSKYVQTVPDGKYLCPDRPRRKLPMSRLSCVHQTFVRSPDFRAFMSRLSCVHQTFVRSCPDFGAFTRLSCVQPIFVSSCPNFRAFDRLSCVHVQTFVRFLMFPDYVIWNARRPPRAFIFGLDILASVWDLNLGALYRTRIAHGSLMPNKSKSFFSAFLTNKMC